MLSTTAALYEQASAECGLKIGSLLACFSASTSISVPERRPLGRVLQEMDQVTRSQGFSRSTSHQVIHCLRSSARIEAGFQVLARPAIPLCSKLLVSLVLNLVRDHLAYDKALQVDGIGTVHRVEGPHRGVMHIDAKIFGMDAVINSGGVLVGVGIRLKFRKRVSYRISDSEERLESIGFTDDPCLLWG